MRRSTIAARPVALTKAPPVAAQGSVPGPGPAPLAAPSRPNGWRQSLGPRDRVFHAHETARMSELEGLPLASFRRRAIALAIDVLAASLVFLMIAMPIALVWDRLHPGHNTRLVFAPLGSEQRNWYSTLAFGTYISLSLYLSNGWTLGKRLLGIRVVSIAAERLSLWHAIERALGYAVSAAEFGLGFLQYFTARNCRTTHDRIADTIVIDARRGTNAPRGRAAGV